MWGVQSREWNWEFTCTCEITQIRHDKMYLQSTVSDVVCKWTFLQMTSLRVNCEYILSWQINVISRVHVNSHFHSLLWTALNSERNIADKLCFESIRHLWVSLLPSRTNVQYNINIYHQWSMGEQILHLVAGCHLFTLKYPGGMHFRFRH